MLKVIDVPSGGESLHAKDDGQQSYVVKEIIKHREDKAGKAYEYLVRWEGYGSKDDSWVHESDFDGMAIIKKYWKKLRNDAKKTEIADKDCGKKKNSVLAKRRYQQKN